MWKLQIVDEEGQRSEVALDRDEVTIGRQDSNTIRLPERNVSRHHARLVRDHGQLYIEDAGSSFGTKVNGAKLSGRRSLNPGDEVRIGDYHLLVWFDRDSELVEAPSLEDDGVYQLGRARLIPQEARCRLVVTEGALTGVEFTLDRTPLSFGRAEDAGIRVEQPGVGTEDAVFTYESGTYFVAESGKYARVKVNSEVVQSAALRPGDSIEIGGLAMRLLSPDDVWSAISLPLVESADVQESPKAKAGARIFIAVGLFGLAAACVVAYFTYYTQPVEAPGALRGRALALNSAETSSPAMKEPRAATGVGREGEAPIAVAAVDPSAVHPEGGAAAEVEGAGAGGAEAPVVDIQVAGVEPVDAQAPVGKVTAEQEEADRKARFGQILDQANGEFAARKWDDAIQKYDDALALYPTNTEVRARRDQAAAEKARSEVLAHAQRELDASRPDRAWEALRDQTMPTTSAYAEEAAALQSSAAAAYAALLVAEGRRVVDREPQRAVELAKQAERLPGTSNDARKLYRDATKVLEKMKAASSGQVASGDLPPGGKLPVDSKESKLERAQALYLEGRNAAVGGNKAKAMDYFVQAAALGVYAAPHKQLGIIYAERGDVEKAIQHYKTYLKMNPSAMDAEQVRYSIERLSQR